MNMIDWFASSPALPARALRCFASFGLGLADMPLGLSAVADERFQNGRAPAPREVRVRGKTRR